MREPCDKYKERLLKNDHRALVELCDFWRAEKDPRGYVLSSQIELATSEIRIARFEPNYTVSRWQCLCAFALRLASPGGLKLAEAVFKPRGRQ